MAAIVTCSAKTLSINHFRTTGSGSSRYLLPFPNQGFQATPQSQLLSLLFISSVTFASQPAESAGVITRWNGLSECEAHQASGICENCPSKTTSWRKTHCRSSSEKFQPIMAEVCGTAKRFISWQAGSEVQPGSRVVVVGCLGYEKFSSFRSTLPRPLDYGMVLPQWS